MGSSPVAPALYLSVSVELQLSLCVVGFRLSREVSDVVERLLSGKPAPDPSYGTRPIVVTAGYGGIQ